MRDAWDDMWGQFRKMPTWGQVLVGGFVILFVLGGIGTAIDAVSGSGGDGGDPEPKRVQLQITAPKDGAVTSKNFIRLDGVVKPAVLMRKSRLLSISSPSRTCLETARSPHTSISESGKNTIEVAATRSGYRGAKRTLVVSSKARPRHGCSRPGARPGAQAEGRPDR